MEALRNGLKIRSKGLKMTNNTPNLNMIRKLGFKAEHLDQSLLLKRAEQHGCVKHALGFYWPKLNQQDGVGEDIWPSFSLKVFPVVKWGPSIIVSRFWCEDELKIFLTNTGIVQKLPGTSFSCFLLIFYRNFIFSEKKKNLGLSCLMCFPWGCFWHHTYRAQGRAWE